MLTLCEQSFLRPNCQRRAYHRVPKLQHNDLFKQNGIPGLLSPEGYELAWLQYQTYLVEKLNGLTQGTVDENAPAGALMFKHARNASSAALFNYASMAHNNHFFFDYLSPKTIKMPENIEQVITESCSSVESLKAEFLATANAMFGPGFVWLVKQIDTAELKIVATYIAGSPYPQAHFRRQSTDMATSTTGIRGGEGIDAVTTISRRDYGAMGRYTNNQKFLAPGGVDITPVLCVNTWEHVWLRDWGISGKAGYLEAWWDSIDWEKVANKYREAGGNTIGVSQRQAVYRRSTF
ncbi:hypothetical protein FQN57_005709 [Myotisia sp. PD_48]|nr:hypothetical protein FQN57_005709 [Myotisia sp. PD_48]